LVDVSSLQHVISYGVACGGIMPTGSVLTLVLGEYPIRYNRRRPRQPRRQ
jgi:hypothetical protein